MNIRRLSVLLLGIIPLLDGCNDTINNKIHNNPSITSIVSRTQDGRLANNLDQDDCNMDLSDKGRYVVFVGHGAIVPGFSGKNIYLRDTWANTTRCVSANRNGVQAAPGALSSDSVTPSISGGGRYVAFSSNAIDLVFSGPDLSGISWHIYRWDRMTGETILITPNKDDEEVGADGNSENPSISWDGTRVAFQSEAVDLTEIDVATHSDIYVRNLEDPANPTTTLITKNHVDNANSDGESELAPSSRCFSKDNRFLVFSSKANNLDSGFYNDDDSGYWDVLVYDVAPTILENGMDDSETIHYISVRLDPGDDQLGADLSNNKAIGTSFSGSISDSGRYVVFISDADNLDETWNDTTNTRDVFVRDRLGEGNIYDSATNAKTRCATIANYYPYENIAGYDLESEPSQYCPGLPSISGDALIVLMSTSGLSSEDENEKNDVYTRTQFRDSTKLVSSFRYANGETEQYSNQCRFARISRDGKTIIFLTDISQLVVFLGGPIKTNQKRQIVKMGPN